MKQNSELVDINWINSEKDKARKVDDVVLKRNAAQASVKLQILKSNEKNLSTESLTFAKTEKLVEILHDELERRTKEFFSSHESISFYEPVEADYQDYL